MSTTRIWITTTFEGFHRWPDAPDEVAFLRHLHRHLFQVKAWKTVNHDDREIEFILFKRQVDRIIADMKRNQFVEHWSCEAWAKQIGLALNCQAVAVSEDGENGADWSA